MARRSFGTHDPNEWLAEGEGLYLSARTLRAQWIQLRRQFKRRQRTQFDGRPSKVFFGKLSGMPRAALLLLAYSAEMYLKSGLIKNFAYCRPGLIDREIRRFGHGLIELAQEIGFQLTSSNLKHLEMLEHLLMDARYPIEPPSPDLKDAQLQYIHAVNARTSRAWNRILFAELCRLVRQLRRHVQLIDGDEKNPASYRHTTIQSNGYVTMRCGGNLAPRITYRDEDERLIPRTVEEIKNAVLSMGWVEVNYYWPLFAVVQDGKKKTVILRHPNS